MNLFCFTLEGSTESIYEPPKHQQHNQDVLPTTGYSPAPLRRTPGWGGSDPCISNIHHSPTKQKRNNRRSHTPMSALDHQDFEGGEEELVSGVTGRHPPTQSAESDLRTAEPQRKLKRFQRLLIVKKANQREAAKGKNKSEADDSTTCAALTAASPVMSCMGLARKSGKDSPSLPGQRRQGKHRSGTVGDEEEIRQQEDDEGRRGESLWRNGPQCQYWSPGGLPQMWTAASVHTPQHRAPPEPWDYTYHGALESRTAPSPSADAPSIRDGKPTTESPNREPGGGDGSRVKVSQGHGFAGRRQRRASNSSESLYSVNSGQSSSSGVTSASPCSSNRNSLRTEEYLLHPTMFCARARVHTDFVPSPYDTESLRLKVGDVVDVVAKPTMGIWRGMLNGKIGSFKFVYVDVLEETGSETKYQSHKPCTRPETLEVLLMQHSLGECSSILRLHGYQAVEDLARLSERHLAEIKEISPDKRRQLLIAAESLQEAQRGCEWPLSSETPAESSTVEQGTRPRDSGCHMPSDCSDNGKDDSEINFPNISPPTLDQISAV